MLQNIYLDKNGFAYESNKIESLKKEMGNDWYDLEKVDTNIDLMIALYQDHGNMIIDTLEFYQYLNPIAYYVVDYTSLKVGAKYKIDLEDVKNQGYMEMREFILYDENAANIDSWEKLHRKTIITMGNYVRRIYYGIEKDNERIIGLDNLNEQGLPWVDHQASELTYNEARATQNRINSLREKLDKAKGFLTPKGLETLEQAIYNKANNIPWQENQKKIVQRLRKNI